MAIGILAQQVADTPFRVGGGLGGTASKIDVVFHFEPAHAFVQHRQLFVNIHDGSRPDPGVKRGVPDKPDYSTGAALPAYPMGQRRLGCKSPLKTSFS